MLEVWAVPEEFHVHLWTSTSASASASAWGLGCGSAGTSSCGSSTLSSLCGGLKQIYRLITCCSCSGGWICLGGGCASGGRRCGGCSATPCPRTRCSLLGLEVLWDST